MSAVKLVRFIVSTRKYVFALRIPTRTTSSPFFASEYKKGIVHILLIVVVLGVFVVAALLVIKFVFKKNLPFSAQKPTVALKTEYQNPFDKKTQYVNPFEEFKNPFTNLNK